jgi:hypothetical protein
MLSTWGLALHAMTAVVTAGARKAAIQGGSHRDISLFSVYLTVCTELLVSYGAAAGEP